MLLGDRASPLRSREASNSSPLSAGVGVIECFEVNAVSVGDVLAAPHLPDRDHGKLGLPVNLFACACDPEPTAIGLQVFPLYGIVTGDPIELFDLAELTDNLPAGQADLFGPDPVTRGSVPVDAIEKLLTFFGVTPKDRPDLRVSLARVSAGPDSIPVPVVGIAVATDPQIVRDLSLLLRAERTINSVVPRLEFDAFLLHLPKNRSLSIPINTVTNPLASLSACLLLFGADRKRGVKLASLLTTLELLERHLVRVSHLPWAALKGGLRLAELKVVSLSSRNRFSAHRGVGAGPLTATLLPVFELGCRSPPKTLTDCNVTKAFASLPLAHRPKLFVLLADIHVSLRLVPVNPKLDFFGVGLNLAPLVQPLGRIRT